MAPASNFYDRTRLGTRPAEELSKALISVGMQVAGERGQMRPAMLPLAVRGVMVDHGRRRRSAVRTLVAQVRPEATGFGLTVARCKHFDGVVVGVDYGPRHNVLFDLLGQRLQQPCRLAHPVGEQGAIKLDAIARVDLGLPVEREMIAIFRDRHVGQYAGVRLPARDRQRRHGWLHHAAAFVARAGGPHFLPNFEVAGDILEDLGAIFAHCTQRAVTPRCGARVWIWVNDRCARQMLGELAARLFAFCLRRLAWGLIRLRRWGWCRGLGLGFGLGFGGLELLELQLELLDLALDAFR